MHTLNQLKPKHRSRFKKRRIGRGESSGWGKTAGRGHKGQQSRSGGGFYVGFEGGQTPIYMRTPKLKGFTNHFRLDFAVVNLETLNELKEDVITIELLKEKGILRKNTELLKVLGAGAYTRKADIKAHKFSASAKEKIEKAGGKLTLLPISVAPKKTARKKVEVK